VVFPAAVHASSKRGPVLFIAFKPIVFDVFTYELTGVMDDTRNEVTEDGLVVDLLKISVCLGSHGRKKRLPP